VNPAGISTHVQMVSEDVLIVVEAQQRDDVLTIYQGTLAANVMVGHVEAVFLMRNQGDQTEAFDVWFPLWPSEMHTDLPLEYLDLAPVDRFAAWVNDAPVEVHYLEVQGETGNDMYALPDDVLIMLTQMLDEHPDQVGPVAQFLGMVYDRWVLSNDGNWHNVPPQDALILLLEKTAEIAPSRAWILEEWERMANATPTPIPSPPTLTAPRSTPTVPRPTPIPTSPPPTPLPTQTGSSGGICAAPLVTALGSLSIAWIIQRKNPHAHRKS